MLNNPFTAFLWVVPWYDLPFTQCIRIQMFSSMTLHVAPGDGFFGTQRTVIWIFHRMNLHVALCVVCGCMIFVIYIQSNNLITMNNMSIWYIFHVALHVTFFTFFLALQVFLAALSSSWSLVVGPSVGPSVRPSVGHLCEKVTFRAL